MQGFMGYLILVIFASEWMKIAPPKLPSMLPSQILDYDLMFFASLIWGRFGRLSQKTTFFTIV